MAGFDFNDSLQIPTTEETQTASNNSAIPENVVQTIGEDDNHSRISMLSSSDSSGVNLRYGQHNNNTTSITSVVSTNSINELFEKESKFTKEEKDTYLIELYNKSTPTKYNSETLSNVSTMVRNSVVKKLKFIDNEHTSGLSKEAIEETRKYPSFWKPDLTITQSMFNDILSEFPQLKKATLSTKVSAWMGMREKVRQAVRGHRNAVQTAIQNIIVDGKNYFLSLIIRYICYLIYTSQCLIDTAITTRVEKIRSDDKRWS